MGTFEILMDFLMAIHEFARVVGRLRVQKVIARGSAYSINGI
jgi:hypothetical protein